MGMSSIESSKNKKKQLVHLSQIGRGMYGGKNANIVKIIGFRKIWTAYLESPA